MSQIYAIDTNILVYAYNTRSEFHQSAQAFLERKVQELATQNTSQICVCQQTCIEFVHAITWQRLEKPLNIVQALAIIDNLHKFGVPIIHPKTSQIHTFSELLYQNSNPSRKKIFATSIVATLKDNGIQGIYTVNVKDFQNFDFLTVINPLSA